MKRLIKLFASLLGCSVCLATHMILTNPTSVSDMSAFDAEARLFVEQHSENIVGLDLEMARGILEMRRQKASRMHAVVTHDSLLHTPLAVDSCDPFERETRARLRNPSRIDQRKSPKKPKPHPLPLEPAVVQESERVAPIVVETIVEEDRSAVAEMVVAVVSDIPQALPHIPIEDLGMDTETEEDAEGPTPEQLALLDQQPDVDEGALIQQDAALYGDEYTPEAVEEMTDGDDYESAEDGHGEFEDIDFESLGIDPGGPTTGKPGSEEKILMLAARYAAGIPLWNNHDAGHGKTDEEDLYGHQSPNYAY